MKLSTLLPLSLALIGAGCSDSTTTPPASTTTFKVRVENVAKAYPSIKSGIFNTPVGATMPGPLTPGSVYEFSFTAPHGSFLSLATMFVPSNDFFYAPDEMGIPLYSASGVATSGDVTSQLKLWDAGTEINQEPGLGADQVERQSGMNAGAADPNATVRLAPDSFTNLPPTASVIRLTITPGAANSFTVRIENVSTTTTLMTSDVMKQAVPLSPGAWVVHTDPAPLFTAGVKDRGEGLELIAEDGNPAPLKSVLDAKTGITVPLSPGVWAVHTGTDPLFTVGSADRAKGLEAIAEDGMPTALATALMGMTGITSDAAFDKPVGAAAAGPIGPGGAYEFTITASAGAKLSLATMFVPSNDLFFAPDGNGIALFNATGTATSGDVTSQIKLWDAGTEINQEPGIGTDQVQRQSAGNSGAADPNKTVRLVSDGFTYPAVSSAIKVTVTPQ